MKDGQRTGRSGFKQQRALDKPLRQRESYVTLKNRDSKLEQKVALGARVTCKSLILRPAGNESLRDRVMATSASYLYLTQQLQEAQTEERKAGLIAAIKNGSVVSWQHINLRALDSGGSCLVKRLRLSKLPA